MSKSSIHITFFFFTLTAITGVLMRILTITNMPFGTYSFILHGHSHMAILGWTFLAVFVIFLKLIWKDLKQKNQAMAIVITTLVITLGMFIAFLIQGYATYSIILSTIHIGIEYWMAVFIYRNIKVYPSMPTYIKLFMKGAIFSLIISTFGPFSLGGLAMAGLKETPFFDMAIYFYLHFQYNGWLFLMLFGLFLYMMYKRNVKLNSKLVTSSFWIYMIALFPGFVLSILWFGLGVVGTLLAVIGAVGQFTGVILVLIAIIKHKAFFQEHFSKHINISLLFIFILLISKSIMEFGLLYEPFARLIFETRSVIIGYLHLTLLGFISVFILTQYQIIGFLQEAKKTVLFGIGIFIIGFALNELILFAMGLTTWLQIKMMFQNELLLLASLLLLTGIITIWSSLMTREVK